MTVFSDRLGALVVNKTQGTFGTALTLTLATEARHIIGMIVSAVDQTYTTAEGGATILRLNSKSLGIVDEEFLTGPYNTSGPATNSSGQAMIQEIIPLDYPCRGGEQIKIDGDVTNTLTTDRLAEVAILYVDGEQPPPDWKQKFPNIVPLRGSQVVSAQQLTVTRTALTAITVPSWAKEIIAYKFLMLKEGAITAGEEILGYIELQSTIKGVQPQEFVSNGLGATLGTPVGTGLYHEKVPWIPMYIKMKGKDETITPYINLRTAVTTGNRVQFALAYR